MDRNKVLIPVVIFTLIIIALIIIFNPSSNLKKLSVSESLWNSIIEDRKANNNLVLKDIKFNDYILIIDEKNNTLYYSVINEGNNKYNPSVSYTANAKKVKLAILEDVISDNILNNKYKLMIYNDKEYHIYNLKITNLPILNISYNENEDIKQNNIPMEMYLFDNKTNKPNKITISSGKIMTKGNSYLLYLQMLTPGKNKRDNRISILNMKPSNEYILTPIINENYVNNRVELFINDEYKGVYSINGNI